MKLINSLDKLEKLLRQDTPDIKDLRKAYDWTLRLRSQLLSAIYDYEQYGIAEKPTTEAAAPVTSRNKRLVTLTINEPLPGLKELTAVVEDHWISMIHKAIFEESKTGIPKFEKAFVMIEITAPRGSNNPKVWDTSNRAIRDREDWAVRGYVLTVAKNSALKVLAKNQRNRKAVDTLKVKPEKDEDVFDRVLNCLDYQLLLRSIQHLDPLYRQVLMLVYVQKQSLREAADVLGRKEETVRKQLYRGRKLLIEFCKKEGLNYGQD